MSWLGDLEEVEVHLGLLRSAEKDGTLAHYGRSSLIGYKLTKPWLRPRY